MCLKTRVSVVIPAFNAEKFIQDAVRSCFSQTFRPLEVLVVNDGSTDSTLDVVSALSKQMLGNQLTLRIIDIGENKGAANALNVGFSNASGNYVCWLSADDLFLDRDKIQKQVAVMSKSGALWSYFRDSYKGKNPAKSALIRSRYLPRLRILDPLFVRDSDLRLMMLIFRNPINGSSIMIRKDCVEVFGQFDPIARNVDADGDLWMRYTSLKLKLNALEGAPVFYREHPTQTSKKKHVMIYGSELTRMRMLLTLDRKGILTKLIKKFALFFPLISKANYHFNRPFASEFVFNCILEQKGKFNPVLVRYAGKSLNKVRKHLNYLSLDREKFLKDLELYKQSYTFKKFEEIFLKQGRAS